MTLAALLIMTELAIIAAVIIVWALLVSVREVIMWRRRKRGLLA